MATRAQSECTDAMYDTTVVNLAVSLISWQAKGACRYTKGALLDTNRALPDTNVTKPMAQAASP